MPMPAKAFCDTSFFYACLDGRDINHQAAPAALEAAAMGFSTDVCPSLHVGRYSDRARVEAVEVFRRYGRDHRLSLCDVLSLVIVSTLLGQIPCFSFDRDFRRLGLSVMP
jgi:predicted nucleic acid-binding protein